MTEQIPHGIGQLTKYLGCQRRADRVQASLRSSKRGGWARPDGVFHRHTPPPHTHMLLAHTHISTCSGGPRPRLVTH